MLSRPQNVEHVTTKRFTNLYECPDCGRTLPIRSDRKLPIQYRWCKTCKETETELQRTFKRQLIKDLIGIMPENDEYKRKITLNILQQGIIYTGKMRQSLRRFKKAVKKNPIILRDAINYREIQEDLSVDDLLIKIFGVNSERKKYSTRSWQKKIRIFKKHLENIEQGVIHKRKRNNIKSKFWKKLINGIDEKQINIHF